MEWNYNALILAHVSIMFRGQFEMLMLLVFCKTVAQWLKYRIFIIFHEKYECVCVWSYLYEAAEFFASLDTSNFVFPQLGCLRVCQSACLSVSLLYTFKRICAFSTTAKH